MFSKISEVFLGRFWLVNLFKISLSLSHTHTHARTHTRTHTQRENLNLCNLSFYVSRLTWFIVIEMIRWCHCEQRGLFICWIEIQLAISSSHFMCSSLQHTTAFAFVSWCRALNTFITSTFWDGQLQAQPFLILQCHFSVSSSDEFIVCTLLKLSPYL
jgi:hypothetical protein